MSFVVRFSLVIIFCFCALITGIKVRDENELRAAFKNAKPGDVIELKARTYKGRFKANTKGTKEKPIILKGTRNSILDGGDVKRGYVLHLNGADYWNLQGFTVRNAQKGIVLDHSNFCTLEELIVTFIGAEAVHFRKFSSDNLIKNSMITDTGKESPGFGEGVYVGSSKNNWPQLTNGEPDKCDRNKVIYNTIGPDVRSENIDIKEGTTGGEISFNTFNGNGLTNIKADKSWVNLKGNDYYVSQNRGKNTIRNGFEVQILQPGWGEGNVFDENHLDVTGGTGYGIFIKKGNGKPNIVYSNNVAVNAPKGLTNIKVTEKN